MFFRFTATLLFILTFSLPIGKGASDQPLEENQPETVMIDRSLRDLNIQEQIGFLKTVKNDESTFLMGDPEEPNSSSFEGCSLHSQTSPNMPLFTVWFAILAFFGWLRGRRRF